MKNLIILLDRFIDWCEPYLKTLYSFSGLIKWLLKIAFALYVINLCLTFIASHVIVVWGMFACFLLFLLIFVHRYDMDPPQNSYISSFLFWIIVAIIIVSTQFLWALPMLFGLIILAGFYENVYRKKKEKDLPPTDQESWNWSDLRISQVAFFVLLIYFL